MIDKDLEVYYPGVYNAEEQKLVDAMTAQIQATNEAAAKVVLEELPLLQPADAFEMMLYNKMLLPETRLYTDSVYAEKSRNCGLIAAPNFRDFGDCYPKIPRSYGHFGRPYNFDEPLYMDHMNYYYAPIRPGDSFRIVVDHHEFKDITPKEGSNTRTFYLLGRGSMYNQRGELVMRCEKRAQDSYWNFADPTKTKPNAEMPMGSSSRPCHQYTDADWEKIWDLYDREYARGSEILYWDDVNIGDEPAPTIEGPMTAMDFIRFDGMRILKQPSLHQVRRPGSFGPPGEGPEGLGDLGPIQGPEKKADGPAAPPPMSPVAMERDRFGIYHSGQEEGFTDRNGAGEMPHFHNTLCRNMTVRTFVNWMGDAGTLRSLGWRIIVETPSHPNPFPADSDRPSYLLKVPYMKGKYLNLKGKGGDLVICRAYVTDKYIVGGQALVELVCWCETIDGDIIGEGMATVELPRR
jgi:hypothetical protein